MKESITIKLPISYTTEQLDDLQALNQGVRIKANKQGNQITLYELAFSFEEVSFFHIQLPANFSITEAQFERLCNENATAKLEFDDYNQLTINMLTTAVIGFFTALIISTILNWSRQTKKGRTYESTARYNLYDKNKKLKRRAADASYISFKTASSEVQSKWKFIEVPPDLAIEIVSSRYDEQKEISKMRNDWLACGAIVGLVVNPHLRRYFVFEQGDIGFDMHPFSTPFVHHLFPDLILDFEALLAEAEGNDQ